MPCCLLALAAFFPRIALIVMWLSGYGGAAYETVLWPVLGFVFMPFTTCAYAIGMNEHGSIGGWALALVILGVILDLGSHGSGARYQQVRTVKVVERR